MTDPHELASVLADLARAGVELAAHGDRLRHRPAVLHPDLAARLGGHKGDVLRLLAAGHAPVDADAAYIFHERLAVADELGLSTTPGSAAWLVAVSESMAANPARAPPTPTTPPGWTIGLSPIRPGMYDTGPEIPPWTRELFAAS